MPDIRKIAQEVYDENEKKQQFTISKVPFHTHNLSDAPAVSFLDLTNKTRYVLYRAILSTTANAVASSVGGSLVIPFGGRILSVGATVDTAGVTGNETIDFLKNGVTIFSTSVTTLYTTIATTMKTSRGNTTIPVIKIQSFDEGDIFTFDIKAVQSTPALGLTLFMKVIETP